MGEGPGQEQGQGQGQGPGQGLGQRPGQGLGQGPGTPGLTRPFPELALPLSPPRVPRLPGTSGARCSPLTSVAPWTSNSRRSFSPYGTWGSPLGWTASCRRTPTRPRAEGGPSLTPLPLLRSSHRSADRIVDNAGAGAGTRWVLGAFRILRVRGPKQQPGLPPPSLAPRVIPSAAAALWAGGLLSPWGPAMRE